MDERDVIDLRSDTVTLPTPAMREAMLRAPLGDDVYGEDPTVRALEERSAGMLGKEAGLLVPSGSQANLIALIAHIRPGDEVIVGENSHCIRYEAGSGAAIAGAQFSVVPGDGRFTAEDVTARLERETLHNPGTALVWVEDTHNMGGGRITPLAEMRRIAAVSRDLGLAIHVDGARVFNAAVAEGVPVAEIAAAADSISFCMSKGLGAPVGSVLCGTREFVERARRLRKRLGGAMRQAGVIAAAGLHALDHHVDRLADDHANARLLAEGLGSAGGIRVDPGVVETNIVMADVDAMDAPDLVRRCAAAGVLFHPVGERRVRLVTHLDVDARDVARATDIVREVLAG